MWGCIRTRLRIAGAGERESLRVRRISATLAQRECGGWMPQRAAAGAIAPRMAICDKTA